MRCHKTGVSVNIALQHLFSWWETEIVPYFTAELLLLLVVLGKAIITIPMPPTISKLKVLNLSIQSLYYKN